MKKIFVLAVIIGFIWALPAFASHAVDFSKAYGVAVVSEPDQYRINNISVDVVDDNGTEKTIFYDVIFQWSTNQCALIPIEIIEVIQPIVPKECDNAFWRILHKKECAGWVDPNDPGGSEGPVADWKCPFELGHHSYCAVCEEGDANRDGTDGCDEGEGQCSGSWHCAKGLVCDPKTHKCVKPE